MTYVRITAYNLKTDVKVRKIEREYKIERTQNRENI